MLGGVNSPGVVQAVPEKIDLAQRLVAAVEPGVDAPAMRAVRRVGRRHDQAVGLHAAIDLGDVAARHQAGRRSPRGVARCQGVGALLAHFEQFLRMRDFDRLEKFVVLERDADGFMEDAHVGDGFVVAQFGDGVAEALQAGL